MKYRIRWLASLMLTLGLSACHAPSTGQKAQAGGNMVLKVYAVPDGTAGNLALGLQAALGKQANFSMLSEGKLLVYGPRDAQASIQAAIATLGANKAEQPAASLNVHVWVVDGSFGNDADDPALKVLEPTFSALRKTMGPMNFRLIQTAAAMASSGQQASKLTLSDGTYSQHFDFRFLGVSDDGVNLQLDYDDQGPNGLKAFNTQVEAPFGKYIVLAQAPGVCPASTAGLTHGSMLANGSTTPSTCNDKPALRLLIVRVDHAHSNA